MRGLIPPTSSDTVRPYRYKIRRDSIDIKPESDSTAACTTIMNALNEHEQQGETPRLRFFRRAHVQHQVLRIKMSRSKSLTDQQFKADAEALLAQIDPLISTVLDKLHKREWQHPRERRTNSSHRRSKQAAPYPGRSPRRNPNLGTA